MLDRCLITVLVIFVPFIFSLENKGIRDCVYFLFIFFFYLRNPMELFSKYEILILASYL